MIVKDESSEARSSNQNKVSGGLGSDDKENEGNDDNGVERRIKLSDVPKNDE
jgi:hypothetical protein